MKILMTSQSVKDYQNYIRCFNFARCLAKIGHDVTLLTGAFNYDFKVKTEYIQDVKVIVMPDIFSRRIRRGGLGPIDIILRIFHVLKDNYDIIHGDGHRPAVFLSSYFAKIFKTTPYISEWVDWFGRGGIAQERSILTKLLAEALETAIEERVRLTADGVIVISKGLQDRAIKIGVEEDKILRLPGGADIHKIRPLFKDKVREELGIDKEAKIIGVVGFEPSDTRDVELILKSLVRVKKIYKNTFLLITGLAKFPEDKKEEYDIRDNLVEVGWVSREDYNKYLACVDVFALPFRSTIRNIGKWPMKIGDFMAAGRPTVSNPVGDIKDLFEKEKIGILAEENDVDFADKILYIFENKDIREELGNNARRLAEEKYSWEILTNRLVDFYHKF